ncbi:MAG: A/G-specific adenine glycosylase [Prevotellaceae bacterium]|nr:A/G-specific adenine glycosylase [Prevotellaceae bacterium]
MNKNSGFRISDSLISWYSVNKRDLPWRETGDPYCIWISEIILQQTRVNQGYDYYLRFIQRFPSVKVLAGASEDEVLKYWQGLGYYSRARNLHKAAKRIASSFNGVFPREYHDVIALSGVGDYTAAAICSLAYNQPYAVVDGNVYRVLSRLFGIATPINSTKGKKEFAGLAQELIDKKHPALYNQAIMDFGALMCTPASPKCGDCPLQAACKAYELKRQEYFPVKENKSNVTNRYFNYLFVNHASDTYLKKRGEKDIWAGLYEFPLIEAGKLLSGEELLQDGNFQRLFGGVDVELHRFSTPVKHKLSHRLIEAQFILLRIDNETPLLKEYLRVPLSRLQDYPVSRLISLFLENGGVSF